MEMGKKRLALLVGCNYPNTQYELHGCVNDVLAMQDTLVSMFGFDPSGIELLTDEPGLSSVMPTGENIKKALGEMVDKAEAGDVLYFHYSGHGTRIPSRKHGNPFGSDEAIVPCDFNLITDVDFRHLVNRLPKGASFTILSDSCHSGGLIDKEKEQIGPNSTLSDGIEKASQRDRSTSPSPKPKAIPFQSILEHISSLTNIATSDVATHMLELFGLECSLKFRLPPLGSLPDTLPRPDDGILLSGCQANETSADLNPAMAGGKACGAFSSAVQKALRESSAAGRLSNREVVMGARQVLRGQGFVGQHPCLYCSDENADAVFLWRP